ncbi:hypothetical protein ABIA33_001033 [Streptacidiphilus sp. MAP12-16]|uniref:hypothetical protein n=1 Tax=Streptacidiphilus sp. MAP12-16 TaxID=3156300 RepID=UPI0035148D93
MKIQQHEPKQIRPQSQQHESRQHESQQHESQQSQQIPGQATSRSGLYLRTDHAYGSSNGTTSQAAGAGAYEELRVDVDGIAPTMTVSGTIWRLTTGAQNWIASVDRQPDGSYSGPIGYREGNPLLRPYTSVKLQLTGRSPLAQPRAVVSFQRTDGQDKVLGYSFARPFFREAEIEVDRTGDSAAVIRVQPETHSHQQVRPQQQPMMDLAEAFARQGIQVVVHGSDEPVDIDAAQSAWSDVELHDAAQRHAAVRTSAGPTRQQRRKAEQQYPIAQQSMLQQERHHLHEDSAQQHIWTLFAKSHQHGPGISGAVLDQVGPEQIQTCVLFGDSYLAADHLAADEQNGTSEQNGTGDAAAQRDRLRFVAAVREIGHALGLADSWDKSRPMAWVPMADEPEARSFMNDPSRVAGGSKAFFADFRYLFSEEELRFLRHMPGRPEQQTAIPWFEHQAFELVRRASEATGSGLRLKIRLARPADPHGVIRFGMLEPVIGEFSLKNRSAGPVVVDRHLLAGEDLGIVVKQKGGEARLLRPVVRHSRQVEPYVLQPGESLQQQIMLSAGASGWQITEPGTYRIYAALRTSSGVGAGGPAAQVLARPAMLQVDRPASREQERIADEVCVEQVGRVLALGGSRVLDEANEVLRRVVDRIPESALAKHAAAALAYAACVPGKVLEGTQDKQHLSVPPTDPQAARPMLDLAFGDLDAAFETFGPVRLSRDVRRVAEALGAQGEQRRASEMTDKLVRCLEQREVKPSAVEQVREAQRRLAGTKPGTKPGEQPKRR